MSSKTATQRALHICENGDWGLCLFFSVDLEGATAYKVETRSRSGGDDWCFVFESFYEEFHEHFLKHYHSLPHDITIKDIEAPVLPDIWKFAGDEILFFAPLTDTRQVLEHINAFGLAIIAYNNELKEKRLSIRCKGTAWIAGFPVNNRIVKTPQRIASNIGYMIDFVGSSIDCGFRLTKFSSPRRLIVSLDLLWMIVAAIKVCSKTKIYNWIHFRFHGEHILKGVFSGKPYPVFWFDLNEDGTPQEDKWNQIPPICEPDAIIAFCEKTENKTSSQDFIKPFICNDISKLFVDIPSQFESDRENLIKYEKIARKIPIEGIPKQSSSPEKSQTQELKNAILAILKNKNT